MSKKKIKDKEVNLDVNDQKESLVSEEETANTNTEVKEKQEFTTEDKIAELNDRFLRLYAEFENYRKRTNIEKVQLISNANASLIKDLLPVIDDFERAISGNEKVEDIDVVKNGFNLIHSKMNSILESKGLKKMETIGSDFDSDIHEAIANVPAPEKKLIGKVIDDVEKGYFLNDKVIRFAKVVVGQ